MSLRDELIAKRIFRENGALSFKARSILNQHLSKLIKETCFLPNDAQPLQRWWHVYNGVNEIPKCKNCNNEVVSWTVRSYRETCCSKCHHLLKNKRGGKTKSENGTAARVYAVQRINMLEKDPDALKNIGQRSLATRRARGTDITLARKIVETLRNDIDENGQSGLQRRRLTQHKNAQNTILEDGSTKAEQVGKNISKVLLASNRLKQAAKSAGEYKRTTKPDGVNSIATLAARKGTTKCRQTKELNGTIVPLSELTLFEIYRREVWRVTYLQDLESLDNFILRGNHADDKNAWHLDHQYSVMQGFLDNISPEIIGNINNLKMLPWLENVTKSFRCDITLIDLLEKIQKVEDL